MERYRKISALVVFLCASTAGAAKIALAPGIAGLEDANLNINLQLQAWITAVENQTPSGTGWNTQAFMRRIRPIFSGDITKQFHFFVQFDSPRFGAYTAADPTGLTGRVLLQDAQVIYEPTPGVFIEMGELLLPLSHIQIQSTTSFVTLDLHGNTLRFPGATAPNQATNGLRELGVATRGWLLDKRLGFRFGVYNGVRGAPGTYDPNTLNAVAVNPDGVPQFGGYLHWNFLDTEERGWLYQGVYFNNKPILSVGFGGGYQPKAIHNIPNFGGGNPQDWRALAADIYAAIPPGPDQEIIFQFDGYNYDFGDHNPNTGNGFFAELGYRYGQFQPQVSYEWFQGNDTPRTADARIWTVGINWWFRRINSLKLELSGSKTGNLVATSIHQIGLQWQLFF